MSSASPHVATSPAPPAAATLREAMSRFATGVIVLSVGDQHIHAMTANAFSSVSLAPPTVLCSVSHSAVMHRAITASRHFGISVLSAGQEGLARHFADKNRVLGAEQFAGVSWEPGPVTRAPLLHGALAWIECELADIHSSGDHSLFIGDVVHSSAAPPADSLLFFNGGFQQASSSSQ